MIHDLDSVQAELERLRTGADADLVPPVLSVFVVEIEGDPHEYEQALKDVMDVALGLGLTEEFEGEDVPVEAVPDWFVTVSSADPSRAPSAARRGREQYLARVASGPWPVQEWLYRFCPEEDSRGWAWWDLTHPSKGTVHIWVDSWGEDFFGCDDLRWLAYAAGARNVAGPELRSAESWKKDPRTPENGNAR
ncbi:hypothetical protein HCC61_01060 [Streptomyces sp. HNM0575]|uniref:hypothetical protein n=1 Tax=Streptomyces sp. HNM0575 TaxID=2716338 RepID=UPI00145DB8D6|nr:hypothetical protein [Streptomyces sp. HNM0575]NLU71302.1 hypothetical protein [Streptomyces sp. HNM0575]